MKKISFPYLWMLVLLLSLSTTTSCFDALNLQPKYGLNALKVYADPANYINVLAKSTVDYRYRAMLDPPDKVTCRAMRVFRSTCACCGTSRNCPQTRPFAHGPTMHPFETSTRPIGTHKARS